MYGFLECDLMSVDEVIPYSQIPSGHFKICLCWIWCDFLEVHVKVWWLTTWLLVTFSHKHLIWAWIHAWLDLNLFAADALLEGLTVKSHCLLLVTDCLDATIVEFFQCCWDNNFNIRLLWEFWLVHSTKCRSEERAVDMHALSIANVVECVVG